MNIYLGEAAFNLKMYIFYMAFWDLLQRNSSFVYEMVFVCTVVKVGFAI